MPGGRAFTVANTLSIFNRRRATPYKEWSRPSPAKDMKEEHKLMFASCSR